MPLSPKVLRFPADAGDREDARREAEIHETESLLLNAASLLLSAASIPEFQDPAGARAVARAARLCTVQPQGQTIKIQTIKIRMYLNQIQAATQAIRDEVGRSPIQQKRKSHERPRTE